MTLGRLVIEGKPLLPVTLHERLDEAVRRRNFLAHGFWYERSHLMTTNEGKRSLVIGLEEDAECFQAIDRDVWAILRVHFEHHGLTDERFNEMLGETRGRPPDPLPTRRRPKRFEQVDQAWLVTLDPPHSTLVFRTVDGDRWQLGDNGLAWSYLDESTGNWKAFDVLHARLPARIEARPPGAVAFNYAMALSTGAVVVVSRTNADQPFGWAVKMTA